MQRRAAIGLISVVVLVGIWLKFSRKDEARNLPLKGSSVAVFGDELLAGGGESSALQRLAEHLGVPIINRGKAGDTSSLALSRIDELIALHPDLVLVTLGREDIKAGLSLADTFGNFEEIFKRLLASGAVVIYGGLWPAGTGDNWPMAISQMCRSMGIIELAKLSAELEPADEFLQSDGSPNQRGHEKIAAMFWHEIKAIWQQRKSR